MTGLGERRDDGNVNSASMSWSAFTARQRGSIYQCSQVGSSGGYHPLKLVNPFSGKRLGVGNVFPFSNENNRDLSAFTIQIRATFGAVVESEAEMASCMHNGKGCSPKGTPLHKCAGYYECSFACENYVCDNHVHCSRYGTFCAQCYPSPPKFDTPRNIGQMHHLAGRAMNSAANHGAAQHR
jgi:hypothetical protein